MNPYRPSQEALITVPTLSPIPLYHETIITDVLSRHVVILDGRKFRKDSREQVLMTEADKMAGGFVARIIPEWHEDFPEAADQHTANLLRADAWEAMKHWQRYPFDPEAASLASIHLTALGNFQRRRPTRPKET